MTALGAEVLVRAEIRGDTSHGLGLIDRIRKWTTLKDATGRPILDLGAKPEFLNHKRGRAIIAFEGNRALGPVIGKAAMEACISLATRHGVGAAVVKNTSHLFTLGYYPRLAALAGCIGLAMVNSAKAMHLPGGYRQILGTNPLAFAAPSESHPLVMDFSTTVKARGYLKTLAAKGQLLPDAIGVFFTKDGQPTKDANLAVSLPSFGGTKGALCAMIVDILSGILSGSGFGAEVSAAYSSHLVENGSGERRGPGAFFAAVHAESVVGEKQLKMGVTRLMNSLVETEPSSFRVPGLKIEQALAVNAKIHLPSTLFSALSQAT